MDIVYKSNLCGDGIRWFDRQESALQFYDKLDDSDGVGLFVLQKLSGTRKFCVASYSAFTEGYYSLHPQLRTFYEVVIRKKPCRLYFDLEFYKEENIYSDGDVIVELFIEYVNHCIAVQYEIQCDRTHIMQLESGTTKKFSQHLVYHIPDAMFKCNQHCGEFVKTICGDAMVAVEHGIKTDFTKDFPIENLRLLFIKRGGKECIIADLLVYHKNQHFRLIHSSKAEKTARLIISDDNCFPISQKDVFLDTLICTSERESRTCQKLEYEISEPLNSPPQPKSYKKHAIRSLKSSLPAVDQFVAGVLQAHPNHSFSFIRSILEFEDGGCINYTIEGTNWCDIAQVCHQRNRVFYVANLGARTLRQMCHSNKCKGKIWECGKIPDEAFA